MVAGEPLTASEMVSVRAREGRVRRGVCGGEKAGWCDRSAPVQRLLRRRQSACEIGAAAASATCAHEHLTVEDAVGYQTAR
jgi:hypothetical protein